MSNDAALIIGLVIGVLTVIRLIQYIYMWFKRQKLARVYQDKHQDFDSILAEFWAVCVETFAGISDFTPALNFFYSHVISYQFIINVDGKHFPNAFDF